MENQSRKRRIFHHLFVLKPVGFVLFLLTGITAFCIVSGNIAIPIYTTVETTVEHQGDLIKLHLGKQDLAENTPIFVYHSRDDFVRKITEYRVDGEYVITDSGENLWDGEKVNVDIQMGEESLFEHIIRNGGNTQ